MDLKQLGDKYTTTRHHGQITAGSLDRPSLIY